jgi:hypothetical protein
LEFKRRDEVHLCPVVVVLTARVAMVLACIYGYVTKANDCSGIKRQIEMRSRYFIVIVIPFEH